MTPTAGQIVWGDLDPTVGREQGGRRPCVVISSTALRRATSELLIVVPCTSRDRGWPNHVPLSGPTGLARPTFAITEQPRALSIDRVHGLAGHVDDDCLALISRWVRTWLHPAA
jgi:mRNA interferase MazF